MKTVKFKQTTETIECECGKVIDADKAYLMEEGGWLCPECLNDSIEEYKNDQLNNFKSEQE